MQRKLDMAIWACVESSIFGINIHPWYSTVQYSALQYSTLQYRWCAGRETGAASWKGGGTLGRAGRWRPPAGSSPWRFQVLATLGRDPVFSFRYCSVDINLHECETVPPRLELLAFLLDESVSLGREQCRAIIGLFFRIYRDVSLLKFKCLNIYINRIPLLLTVHSDPTVL